MKGRLYIIGSTVYLVDSVDEERCGDTSSGPQARVHGMLYEQPLGSTV